MNWQSILISFPPSSSSFTKLSLKFFFNILIEKKFEQINATHYHGQSIVIFLSLSLSLQQVFFQRSRPSSFLIIDDHDHHNHQYGDYAFNFHSTHTHTQIFEERKKEKVEKKRKNFVTTWLTICSLYVIDLIIMYFSKKNSIIIIVIMTGKKLSSNWLKAEEKKRKFETYKKKLFYWIINE